MQARIRKEDLLTFKAEAADIIIKRDLQPILSFLKIEINGDFATITKSNNRSFIVKTIPADTEDGAFLVDEQTVYNIVEASDADYIEFDSSNNRIRVSGGHARLLSPTEPVTLYPLIDLACINLVPIPKIASTSAGICSKIVMDGELPNYQSHVFIGGGFVAGADGNIGFFQPVSDEIPKLILRRDVAATLGKMNAPEYGSNASYDLFKNGTTLWGFVKSELSFFDKIETIFKGHIDDKAPDFSINKNQMLRFVTLVLNQAPKNTAATFEMKTPNLLYLQSIDESGVEMHMELPVKGDKAEFKFDPDQMQRLLNTIPCDDVYFYSGANRYFVTDMDKSFITAIMRII